MLFEGRHGNSMRIGSRFVNPYVFISNKRGDTTKVGEVLSDGSLISITSKVQYNNILVDNKTNINEQEKLDSFEIERKNIWFSIIFRFIRKSE